MDIAALKEEARALEQRGRAAEALALYRKALARLEGTQDIWRELPLYVKAGDLNLKLQDGKTAIAMYERAAKRYAQYGSGKSVLALCSKILRVSPSRTYVFLAFARVMIERGHVTEAAKVLAGYAELVKLKKAHEVIQRLSAAESAETRPVLEMLLEIAGRAENAKLRTGDRLSDEAERSSSDTPDEADRTGRSSREAVERSAGAAAVTTGERPRVGDENGGTGPRRAVPHEPEGMGAGKHRGPEASLGQEKPDSEVGEGPTSAAQAETSGSGETAEEGKPATPAFAESSDSHGKEEASDEDTFQVTQGYTPIHVAEALSRAKQAVERAAELEFSPTIEPPPEQEPAHDSHGDHVERPARAVPGQRAAGEAVRARPPLTHSGPRPQQTFTAHRSKPSKRGWPWAVLAVILIAGGGGALVLGDVVGGGGETGVVGEPNVRPADAPQGDSQAVPGTGDTAGPTGGGETTAAERAAPVELAFDDTVPEVVDSGVAGLPDLDGPAQRVESLAPAAPDVSIDTVQRLPASQTALAAAAESVTTEPALPDLPPDVTVTRPIIVIRGLPIESVTEFPDGEHRVVQLLGSGERLVLTARPVTEAVADTIVAGVVTVRAMLGASTVGSVLHAEHLVEAQGRVAADTLRLLLSRLGEIRP